MNPLAAWSEVMILPTCKSRNLVIPVRVLVSAERRAQSGVSEPRPTV